MTHLNYSVSRPPEVKMIPYDPKPQVYIQKQVFAINHVAAYMIWHGPRSRVYKDTLTKQNIPRAQRFTQELVNDQWFLWNVQGLSPQAC